MSAVNIDELVKKKGEFETLNILKKDIKPFYKNSDILTLPDPLEPNQFLPNPADIEKYKRQAVNVDSV
jgi:hypothetical protein